MPRHRTIETRGTLDMNRVAERARRQQTPPAPRDTIATDWSPHGQQGWNTPRHITERPRTQWTGSAYVDHSVQTPLHIPQRRKR